MIRNKIIRNASWIIVGKIGQALLGLVVTMLTARFLGPSNYGIISYAASIVTFVTPIMQLGLNEILVQEIVDKPNKEGIVVGTSILLNFISALACMIGVWVFANIVNVGELDTIIVCGLYSVMLVFQAFDIIKYWFQAKYLAKYISIISLVSYTIVSMYKIFLLVSNKSIYWFAISNSIDCGIIAILSLMLYHKVGNQKLAVSLKVGKFLIQKSKYYIISGLMVNVFAQTDKIMLNLFIDEASTGYYTAAVTCAALTSFIFVAIIDSLRPAIFEARKVDIKKYEKTISILYMIVIYMSLAQSLIMTIFAPLIINIVYGKAYVASISVLRLIVWYTTFSYMGPVRNIWMLAEGKQKYIWQINLSGALLNVLLNTLLIPLWGSMGAALASMLTQFFTNVIIGFILEPIRHNNKLMLDGLNPRLLLSVIRKRRI